MIISPVTKVLGIAVMVLGLGLAGTSWFAYKMVQKTGASDAVIAQLSQTIKDSSDAVKLAQEKNLADNAKVAELSTNLLKLETAFKGFKGRYEDVRRNDKEVAAWDAQPLPGGVIMLLRSDEDGSEVSASLRPSTGCVDARGTETGLSWGDQRCATGLLEASGALGRPAELEAA